MSAKKIRVGVIGVGRLGRYHLQNYMRIPEAELVGAYDADPHRLEEPAELWGVRPYAALPELLADVEAVSIAVPTSSHLEVGLAALEAGVHVLMEKPLAANLQEAATLRQAADRAGCVLHVGHVERFNPAIVALSNTELNPRFIESHRLAPFDPRGTDVPVILDLMIHDIDLVLSLVQAPVRRIDARGVAVVSEDVDIANARLEFGNGCVANLTASRISQRKMRKLRLFQRDAYVSIDLLLGLTEVFRLEEGEAPPPGKDARMVLGQIDKGHRRRAISYERLAAPELNALEMELREFLKAVRGEPNRGVTAEEATRALEVALAVEENVRQHQIEEGMA
ncbi:MAG: Gfo/Idh/MocA family oxidoreductase [candidate division KSB1 bacterium]|nr:Gfo/Idh/MocA family oxidoreductase [candidate division KSB1 bacterium]